YDVSDYRGIHPDFGDLAEADALVAAAHQRGIRVLIDLVPNHTSVSHPWFQAAVAAGPGSAERDRYIFLDGKGDDGSEPPTNWVAVFGGSAWEQVDDRSRSARQWYLHLFDTSQPDLNWENDEVRQEFDDIFRFWLDRGIDGFRIDVAHSLTKDRNFPDTTDLDVNQAQRHPDGSHPHWDRDDLHQIVRRWRRVVDGYDDRMMVAEANVHASRLPLYLRPGEYHQAFNFDLLRAEWSAKDFAKIVFEAWSRTAGIGAASTWVLSNHDVVRHSTRYGLPPGVEPRPWLLDGPHELLDADAGARRGRAATLIALALPGSTYIYQGDELGLPEVWDLPTASLQDPSRERSNHTDKGRDGCRVPVPWTVDGPSFGFGSAGSWLPQPPSFGPLSVEAQDGDPTSTLSLYRTALRLRRELFRTDENLVEVDLGPGVFSFGRGNGAVSITNMGTKAIPLPAGADVALCSGELIEDDGRPLLPPDTGVWLRPPSAR
ncbi:MAG: alpha-amylase family glycosyl hydrolase, partial [Acidimicrobiia bacterium]|nr:alpha-amylase family glycosyl hydrolase [Acidimicrobiia bacterium]